MGLEDLEDLPGLTDARSGVGSLFALLHVNEKAEGVLSRWHELDNPLNHEDQVLDLSR